MATSSTKQISMTANTKNMHFQNEDKKLSMKILALILCHIYEAILINLDAYTMN